MARSQSATLTEAELRIMNVLWQKGSATVHEVMEGMPAEPVLAYNSVLNKPPPKQNFDQRWAAWGSAFGGSSITDGNAVVGSTNVTASDFGVAAGMPETSEQTPEGRLSINAASLGVRPGINSFALRVRGDSMIDEQIRDGDFVVVHERRTADNGEMVIALLNGSGATVKKLYRERDGRIRLQPANETMSPMYVHERDVEIQGIVVGVLRRY